MRIDERAPAKINLALDVKYKRPDGYHEVEMIMTMVDLADRLRFEPLPDGEIRIVCQSMHIPLDEKNLAFQAAKLLNQTLGMNRGVQIELEKVIPVSAGLAGGSSDAAATLRGLNRLWNLNLSLETLEVLGGKIGSDVPFCIRGGTALATGRGEILQKLPPAPACWVVIAKPPIGVSTADVYGRFRADEIRDHPDVRGMIQAIEMKSFEGVVERLGNVLEDVTLKLYPEVSQIKDRMNKLGLDGVLMSGSGPTVFGITDIRSKAERAYNGLRGFCKDVYVVRLLTT